MTPKKHSVCRKTLILFFQLVVMNKKADIGNTLARALFMVLLFVVLSAFTHKQEQANFSRQYETLAELQPTSASAIITDLIQLPALLKCQPTLVDKSGFILFNDHFKILADNRHATQRLIVLQRESQLSKPVFSYRFYYHLFPIDAQDPPALS